MDYLLPVFDSLEEKQQSLIRNYLDAVIEANKTTNLTRIDDLASALLLHVEDSLTALPELERAPEGAYADIGTGGGFPGVPLAIATGRETVLVDSRKKKMDIVQSILEELGLSKQISVFSGRAELLARKEKSRFSVITARALAKLPVLLELGSPLLKMRGVLICYKAQIEESELEDAKRVTKLVGMKMIGDRSLTLGDEYTRRFIEFEKVGVPKVSLPRREGEAQRNPLR